jgi:ABC-type dipeptide/oligopeptide/nickel transport system permease component
MNKKIYTPIILALTLFLTFFVMKPLYTDYTQKQSELQKTQKDLESYKKKMELLMSLKTQISSWAQSDIWEKVKKMGSSWNPGQIMSTIMISEYTKPTGLGTAPITIGSISVNPGNKLPSGLSLGSVSFSVRAESVQILIDYLTYLTKNAPRIFVIDAISLPIDTRLETSNEPISLSLTLGVYYYDEQ